MALHFETDNGRKTVALQKLTVAGWTGRDQAAVRHHIEELAAIGVPAPSETPLFYAVSPSLATQADEVTVLGEESSGEVEPFLIRIDGRLWLGLGSDHTDRELEAFCVAHSKQICAKPVATKLWPFEAVADRLDELELTTWIGGRADRTIYQKGTLSDILPLASLLERRPLGEGEAMLCGTLPALGGVRPAAQYEMEIRDPAGRQSIRFSYRVRSVPVVR